MNTNTRIHDALTTAGIDYHTVTYEDTDYIVTNGTGETGYGSDGGDCAFAYEDGDVLDWSFAVEDGHAESTYESFCEYCTPVEDRALAIYLAAMLNDRLTMSGTCDPVLTDDEWQLVRETAKALDS